jgi:hypothetical protein
MSAIANSLYQKSDKIGKEIGKILFKFFISIYIIVRIVNLKIGKKMTVIETPSRMEPCLPDERSEEIVD